MRKTLCVMLPAAMIAAIGLVGCTMARSLPTAEELSASGALPEGADIAELNRGRALAVTKCSGCHRFYWPEEYSPREWTKIVRRHRRRVSMGQGRIGAYFVTAARVSRETAGTASGARAAPGQ